MGSGTTSRRSGLFVWYESGDACGDEREKLYLARRSGKGDTGAPLSIPRGSLSMTMECQRPNCATLCWIDADAVAGGGIVAAVTQSLGGRGPRRQKEGSPSRHQGSRLWLPSRQGNKGKAKSKAKNGMARRRNRESRKIQGRAAQVPGEPAPIYLGQQGRGKVTDFFAKMWPLWWEAFPWYTAVQGVAPGTALATGAAASDDNVSAAALESGGASVNSSGEWTRRNPAVQASDGKGPAAAVSTDGALLQTTGRHRRGEALVGSFSTWGNGRRPGEWIPLEATVKRRQLRNSPWTFVASVRRNCWTRRRMTSTELAEALEAEHEAAMTEYYGRAEAMSNPELPSAAKMDACRKNLVTVAQPFLDGIAKLTGFHVTLLAGAGPPAGSERFTLTTRRTGPDILGMGRGGLQEERSGPIHEIPVGDKRPRTGGATWAIPPPTVPPTAPAASGTPAPRPISEHDTHGPGAGGRWDGGRGNITPVQWGRTKKREAESARGAQNRRRKHHPRRCREDRRVKIHGAQAPTHRRLPLLCHRVEPYTRIARWIRTHAGDEGPPGDSANNERRERLYQLGRLSKMEFTHENALVRNRALLERLNLKDATKEILSPALVEGHPRPRPPANKSAAQEGPTRKSSRLAGQGAEVEGENQPGGKARGEESGGDVGRSSMTTRRAGMRKSVRWRTVARRKAERRRTVVRRKRRHGGRWREGRRRDGGGGENEDGTMGDGSEQEGGAMRTVARRKGGSEWDRGCGDVDPARKGLRVPNFGETRRSTSVAQERPLDDEKIKVKSQEKLVKDWWKWWGCLAPAWRDKDENGVLKTGETKGEWGPLVHPGANGMLTCFCHWCGGRKANQQTRRARVGFRCPRRVVGPPRPVVRAKENADTSAGAERARKRQRQLGFLLMGRPKRVSIRQCAKPGKPEPAAVLGMMLG
ncbi:hypothetical protein B0H14DRAFT_2645637 [Mycena olivaceomarginata]|nr:hypothetical protein B0H14DRAFT_2645637 [Mycena olivaceomarginata]